MKTTVLKLGSCVIALFSNFIEYSTNNKNELVTYAR